MFNFKIFSTYFIAFYLALSVFAQEKTPPNVIYILADDLGKGDLGCYGQKKLKTPSLDRLAKEGMKFSSHYSGNTVCSPSRAVLMTGQHPGHVHCRGNGNEPGLALDPKMTTLPEIFKNAGYATGAFGKWGLGHTNEAGAQNPLSHGFDHFSGWKNQMIAHTYYPTSIVRDGKEIPLKEGTYIHDLIMDDAFSFIEKSVKQKKPFFCYIPTAVPHAAMHAPKELHEKWRKVYPEFDQRIGKYGAGPGEPCPNVVNPIAGYAAMMENFDNQVGHLLNILKDWEWMKIPWSFSPATTGLTVRAVIIRISGTPTGHCGASSAIFMKVELILPFWPAGQVRSSRGVRAITSVPFGMLYPLWQRSPGNPCQSRQMVYPFFPHCWARSRKSTTTSTLSIPRPRIMTKRFVWASGRVYSAVGENGITAPGKSNFTI